MPQPNKIPRPFADSGDKNSIPESSGALGFASWQEGFPAITGTPFAQGGVAPKRADFNGIFNALSAATVWNQQGGVYAYDNSTDYEVGNVVLYSGNLYKCITANGPGSAVKAPTDTTVWDAIATKSGYLPLSGGTLSGNLNFSTTSTYIEKTTNNGTIAIYAGNNIGKGAEIVLYGKDYPSAPGEFQIRAKDGTNSKVLRGYPTGALTWDGKNVPVLESGTFTPTMLGSTVVGSFTYTSQKGYYLKIDKLCFVSFDVGGTVVTAPTGNFLIGGFPYLASDAYQSLLVNIVGNSTHTSNAPIWLRVSAAGSGGGTVWGVDGNGALAVTKFATLAVGAAVGIRFSGIYRTV